jgi:hypothetical protein
LYFVGWGIRNSLPGKGIDFAKILLELPGSINWRDAPWVNGKTSTLHRPFLIPDEKSKPDHLG